MPKMTATQRIIDAVQMQGMVTTKELTDKYDVTEAYINILVNKVEHPVARLPRYIVGRPGTYKKWTVTSDRIQEIEELMRRSAECEVAYRMTSQRKYKVAAVQLARKVVACTLDYLVIKELLTAPGLPVDSEYDTTEADAILQDIKRIQRTKLPVMTPMYEKKEKQEKQEKQTTKELLPYRVDEDFSSSYSTVPMEYEYLIQTVKINGEKFNFIELKEGIWLVQQQPEYQGRIPWSYYEKPLSKEDEQHLRQHIS